MILYAERRYLPKCDTCGSIPDQFYYGQFASYQEAFAAAIHRGWHLFGEKATCDYCQPCAGECAFCKREDRDGD